MKLDFLVSDTFAGIAGVESLVTHANNTIPKTQLEVLAALKRRAEGENWDYNDYDAERQSVEYDYLHWLPKLNHYGAVILLASVLEAQLVVTLHREATKQNTTFDAQQRGRKSILQYLAAQLKALVGVDLTADPSWNYLKDLQTLRNIIAHRAGHRGTNQRQADEFDALIARYDGLTCPEKYSLGTEVVVTKEYCIASVEEMKGFFKRVFLQLGYRDYYLGNHRDAASSTP